MVGHDDENAPLARTERRWLEVHRQLLDATIDELLGPTPNQISATSIAARADRAAGTFHNHFTSVEDAVEEALLPDFELREAAVQAFVGADDPAAALPDVIGLVIASIVSGNREMRAGAVARSVGYPRPTVRPLASAAIDALGGPRSPSHVRYSGHMISAAVEALVLLTPTLEDPLTVADVEQMAWTLVATTFVPSPQMEAIVARAVVVARAQLGMEQDGRSGDRLTAG